MEQGPLDKTQLYLRHLAYSMPEAERADALQNQVERMIRAGRPRDALYEDLKSLVLVVRRDGRNDLEDAIMDVMDTLVGWCAPSGRI